MPMPNIMKTQTLRSFGVWFFFPFSLFLACSSRDFRRNMSKTGALPEEFEGSCKSLFKYLRELGHEYLYFMVENVKVMKI